MLTAFFNENERQTFIFFCVQKWKRKHQLIQIVFDKTATKAMVVFVLFVTKNEDDERLERQQQLQLEPVAPIPWDPLPVCLKD